MKVPVNMEVLLNNIPFKIISEWDDEEREFSKSLTIFSNMTVSYDLTNMLNDETYLSIEEKARKEYMEWHKDRQTDKQIDEDKERRA